MDEKLPTEILLRILALVGEDSTLYLGPVVLLNRRCHGLAAPILLSTISVSSLGNLMKLCDHIKSSSNTTKSIETFTKTLVIAGKTWGDGIEDSYVGLEDVSELPPRNNVGGSYIKPDTDMPTEQILSNLRTALSHFVALDGLEWYGRFTGDYHLVRCLQDTGMIQHLAYEIDEASNRSIGE